MMERHAIIEDFHDISGPDPLEIHRRLCSTGHQALRCIECECYNATVVLRGRVPTYYCKQLAQTVLLNDPSVKIILNLIDVYDESFHDE